MTARPRTKRWRGWAARCVEPAEGSHLWTKPARGWSTSAPTNASALQGGDVVGERPALPLSKGFASRGKVRQRTSIGAARRKGWVPTESPVLPPIRRDEQHGIS